MKMKMKIGKKLREEKRREKEERRGEGSEKRKRMLNK